MSEEEEMEMEDPPLPPSVHVSTISQPLSRVPTEVSSRVPSQTASKVPTATSSKVPTATSSKVPTTVASSASKSRVPTAVGSSTSRGPTQATRSYMFIETSGTEGASMLYEKDGQFRLGRIPPYTQAQSEKRKAAPIRDPSSIKPGAAAAAGSAAVYDYEEDEEEVDPEPLDPGVIALNALTGVDTVPCNLCDENENYSGSLHPVWSWLYENVGKAVCKVKEIKRDMDQKDVGCGAEEPGTTKVKSKGTQMQWVDWQ